MDPVARRAVRRFPRMRALAALLALSGGKALAAEPAPPAPAVAAAATPPAAAPHAIATRLDRDAVDEVAAVVVTGSRTERPLGEAPVATEVITPEEIKESGARDVAELLEDRPGIQLNRSFAGAGPELQGLPPDYTLILVDGMRVPGRVNGVVDLSRFATENVDRIEIVRGASSSLYGADAIGGVINIITRSAQRLYELSGEAGLGPQGRLDLSGSAGMTRKSWSVRINGGRHASDGYDLDPSDLATTQPAFQQYDVAQRSEFTLYERFRLITSADYTNRARQGIDQSGVGATFDRTNLTQTASAWLRPEWELSSSTKWQLRAGYSLFRDEFELDQRGSNELDESQDTRENLGQLGTQLDTLLGGHLLSVGAEGSLEKLETERLSEAGDRRRLAFYVQDEWTLLEAPLLVVMPSARLDLDSQFGTYPTPRVAVRFDPASPVTLRASYGWGFKAPDFRELYLLFENPSAGYLVEGNTDLDPERSRNLNASVEYHPTRSFTLSVQGFYNLLDDRIDTVLAPAVDTGPQRFQYENVNSALTRGINASLSVSPMPGLRLDLGYDFTDARSRDDERRLSGQPYHRATASLRYRVPSIGFETLWRAAFVGERPFYQDLDGDGAEEQRDAYAYASVDWRVAQRLGYGFGSFFMAQNLLDAGDPEFTPLPPRSFFGGVQYDY